MTREEAIERVEEVRESRNGNLHAAKNAKNDEFYTRGEDIDKELGYYKNWFKDKIVYCNCDDPIESSFCEHFILKFNYYGLKKLIFTSYQHSGIEHKDCDGNLIDHAYKVEMTAVRDHQGNSVKEILNRALRDKKFCKWTVLKGDGDFRSPECIAALDECDVVVTNPPFSLFREFIGTIVEHNKNFLVIGNMNAITYKEIFPLIKDNKLWLGINPVKSFLKPDGTIQNFGNILWFTNIPHSKRNDRLELTARYSSDKYPKYDNYNAIEVSKTIEIPRDYMEVMGVPITFLDKYNPNQFEILDARDCTNIEKLKHKSTFLIKDADGSINGKNTYARIVIKRRPEDKVLQDELDAII